MVRGLCALALLPGTLPASARVLRASPSDAAASRAYLFAQETKLREQASYITRDIAAMRTLGNRIAAECEGVLAAEPHPPAGTPPTGAQTQMHQESLFIILGTPERTERRVYERFEHSVLRTHWTSRALTRLVHDNATERAEQARIEVPNLCSDLDAWAASHYTVVPQDTKKLLRRLAAVSSLTNLTPEKPSEALIFDVDAVITRMLKPYEDWSDRRLAKRLQQLKSRQGHSDETFTLASAAKSALEAPRSVA